MKELTKAEEQVMQVLWQLEKAFLKDLVEAMPAPKPAYPTVSTVVRVMVKKGFIGFTTYGKVNEYYPLIKKEDYFKVHFKGMVKSFFKDSWQGFASFYAKDSDLSLEELEAMQKALEAEIKKKKANE